MVLLRLNWREWKTETVLEWLKVSALVVIAAGVCLCSRLLLNIYVLLSNLPQGVKW